MNIGFVGAGRVSCTIGKYLTDAGITVEGYYSRTRKSVDIAATFTKTRAYESLDELVKICDIIFIATSDGAIEDVWNCIKKFDLRDKVIGHFSGSLSSDIFSGIEETRAYGCSIHPIYAFSDKFTSYRQFNNVCLTMEGNEKAVHRMKNLFGNRLGHKIFTLNPEDKIKYHAAAAFASNYMVALMENSISLMEECGFSEKDTFELFAPLVRNNISALIENGTVAALTGPAERNDIGTVKKHLEVLDGTNAENVYKVLGRTIVSIAKRKNPDTDYTVLENLMV